MNGARVQPFGFRFVCFPVASWTRRFTRILFETHRLGRAVVDGGSLAHNIYPPLAHGDVGYDTVAVDDKATRHSERLIDTRALCAERPRGIVPTVVIAGIDRTG